MSTLGKEAISSGTVLTPSDMGTLANNTNSALSSAFDGSVAKDVFADFKMNIGVPGSARSAGGWAGLYLVPAIDGSVYDNTDETTAEQLGVLWLPANTTAYQKTFRGVEIPQYNFKIFVRNNATGQAFAGTNSVTIYTYSLTQT